MCTVIPVTMTHHNVHLILARMVLDMATHPNRRVGSTCSNPPRVAIPVETLAPTPLVGILAHRRPSLNRILASLPMASRVCLTSKARIAGYTALHDPLHTGNLPNIPRVVWAPGTT